MNGPRFGDGKREVGEIPSKLLAYDGSGSPVSSETYAETSCSFTTLYLLRPWRVSFLASSGKHIKVLGQKPATTCLASESQTNHCVLCLLLRTTWAHVAIKITAFRQACRCRWSAASRLRAVIHLLFPVESQDKREPVFVASLTA